MKIRTPSSRINELASRLESDIRRRKLSQGDTYLTVAGAAKFLAVNAATANQALQLLAQRKVLVRGQRRSAKIEVLDAAASANALRRVYLLVHRAYLRQEGYAADGVLAGIEAELPGAVVQFNFLPATDPAAYVTALIGTILRGREPAGVVISKAPFAAQRLVEDSGLPAVVYGSRYPSIRRLSCLEQDNNRIAQLMADHALKHGCDRVVVLTRDVMFPGDDVVLRELSRLLGQAGFTADRFKIAHLPDDIEAMAEAIAVLLDGNASRLGLLCRSEIKAQAAVRAIEKRGLKNKDRPAVIVSGLYRQPDALALPHIYPAYTPEEIGACLGRMLAQQALHPEAPPANNLIPVELAG